MASVTHQSGKIRVLGLSGSMRQNSFNTALLRAAQDLVPDDMRVELYDLSSIPMYNDDLRVSGYPLPVARLREDIRVADALLIASPEYNRSVPAVLKNAIDWASRSPDQPFKDKPIAIMGVSNGALGAAFANYHLRQIFVYMDAQVVNGPEVMIGNAKEKFDLDGRLIHEPTRAFVAAHLEKLAVLAGRTRNAALERCAAPQGATRP
jgi:chromate reductase, NAD(P)H dehydrogenase (quinone)